MIRDTRSLQEDETIDADVCIVGAGTAGLTIAREFIGQRFNVCLLESGGMKPDRETQSLFWGENIGHPYFQLDTARVRYYGGSTNRWHIPIGDNCVGARMRPLDTIDFEKRDWVPHSGWPFRKVKLDPFYERAQAICKIAPATYDVSDWEDSEKSPRLPFVGENIKTVIFKFGSRIPFVKDYADAISQAANITTYLYANVIEIETNETGEKITRLRVACLGGNKSWFSARMFILAAGAIEIPRLLLLSNKNQDAGLGNQNDLVGRFFMEHPHFWSGIYAPSSSDIFKSASLYGHIHNVKKVPIIGKLSLTDDVVRQEKLLGYVAELMPRITLKTSLNQFLYPGLDSKSVKSFKIIRASIIHGDMPDNLYLHLKNMVAGLDDLFVATFRTIRKRAHKIFNKKRILLFKIANMCEQIPNPDSRVSLSNDRDCFGQNRVQLDWRLSPIDITSAIRSQEILDSELRRSGLGRLFLEINEETASEKIKGGWHHMGTTRMHNDPRKGVVDENCRVHGISNLFIAGPSVFPTSGYANPSLTIVALAVKLSDHIKELMV